MNFPWGEMGRRGNLGLGKSMNKGIDISRRAEVIFRE